MECGARAPCTRSVSKWPCPGPSAAQQLAASCLVGQESTHPDARGRRGTKKQLLIPQPWEVSTKLWPECGNEQRLEQRSKREEVRFSAFFMKRENRVGKKLTEIKSQILK